MDNKNQNNSIWSKLILVVVTIVGTLLGNKILEDRSSLEIISRPEEIIIDKKGDSDGLKISFDNIELNKLVKYKFTLWNNGGKEFPEGTFDQQPVIIKFKSQIRGIRTEKKSSSRLEWDLSRDEQNNQVSIRPLGVFNKKSWISFNVYVDDVLPEPYIIDEINILGVTEIGERFYDQTQEIIRKKASDVVSNFILILFLIVFIFAFFHLRYGLKNRNKAVEILDRVNLDEENKSELKKIIEKLFQTPNNIISVILFYCMFGFIYVCILP